MILRSLFILFVAALIITAVAGVCSAEFLWYYGTIDPATPGSCGSVNGTLYQWTPWTGGSGVWAQMGTVVDDPDAWDGKAYYIDDNRTDAYEAWRTQPSFNIDAEDGATIVARIKTVAETDDGGNGNIGILHDKCGALVHVTGPANPGHIRETWRNSWVEAVTDGNYHIIRLTSQGSFSGRTVPYAESFDSGYVDGQLVDQNDWDGNAVNELANTIQIIDDPVPDASGDKSVIIWGNPTGPNPGSNANYQIFAEGDANGKITVTAKILHGGPGTNPEPTFIWDLSVRDINNVQLSGWDGKYNTARPRIGDSVLASQDLVPGTWHTLKVEIDVVNRVTAYWFDSTSLGTIAHPATAGNTARYIVFTSKANASSEGHVVHFDDLAIDGGQFTGGRQINVYVDEQLPAKLTIRNAPSINRSPDSLLMGALSTAGLQQVYFDWIAMTNEGTFAPGEETRLLGRNLVPPQTAVASIGTAKLAPPGTEVILTNVVVTGVFHDLPIDSSPIPASFAVEEADRSAGIRVLGFPSLTGDPLYLVVPGQRVNMYGQVGSVNGEVVLYAMGVTQSEEPAVELLPLYMNERSSGGGAFGLQEALVKDATVVSSAPKLSDSFTYPDGILNGNGGWIGNALSEITVENGKVKLVPGSYAVRATKETPCGDGGTGAITVKVNAKGGPGDSNFWIMYVRDSAGNELGRWYGRGSVLRGRIDGSPILVTSEIALKPAGSELTMRIYPASRETEFIVDGVSYGKFSYVSTNAGTAVGKIEFERIAALGGAAGDYILFDDLALYPSPLMSEGLNSVGQLTKISGKVTAVTIDSPLYENSFFYVDDGSGLQDGSGYTGIRCRILQDSVGYPAPNYAPLNIGEDVTVTGVMGVKQIAGNNARFIWTTSWSPLE